MVDPWAGQTSALGELYRLRACGPTVRRFECSDGCLKVTWPRRLVDESKPRVTAGATLDEAVEELATVCDMQGADVEIWRR